MVREALRQLTIAVPPVILATILGLITDTLPAQVVRLQQEGE